jgi:hypothetical protein
MPKLLKSAYLLRLFCMGESVYLLYFHISVCFIFTFICSLLPGETGQILPFIYMIFYVHFHIFIAQQCLFHSLFRMGESNYLYDNLGYKSLSQTKRKILFFLFIF